MSTNWQQSGHPVSPGSGRDGEAYDYDRLSTDCNYNRHVGMAEKPIVLLSSYVQHYCYYSEKDDGGGGRGHSGFGPLHNSTRFVHQDLSGNAGGHYCHPDSVLPTSGRLLSLEGNTVDCRCSTHSSQKSLPTQ